MLILLLPVLIETRLASLSESIVDMRLPPFALDLLAGSPDMAESVLSGLEEDEVEAAEDEAPEDDVDAVAAAVDASEPAPHRSLIEPVMLAPVGEDIAVSKEAVSDEQEEYEDKMIDDDVLCGGGGIGVISMSFSAFKASFIDMFS